jgi:hypothetical protein
MPRLPEQQIAQLAEWIAQYITEQRASFVKKASPIAPEQKFKLRPFFPAEVLNDVRVVQGRATEPAFYSRLRPLGIHNAPPFSEMAGITFEDVVVHTEPLTDALLFHELVHAAQYRHLGLRGFAERYVRGFLTGGSYEEIPLEKEAYELEARFSSDPKRAFSVDDDIKARIRNNQL